MGTDPIVAHGNRTIDDGDRPPIRTFDDGGHRLSLHHRRQKAATVFPRIAIEVSVRLPETDNLFKGTAGPHDLRRELVHLDVALIANDKAPRRIEHHHALRHVVQRRGQQPAVLVKAAVSECADEAHPENSNRRAGHGHRQRCRRERKRGDDTRRIGNDFNGAHCREVVRYDRERQQDCGCKRAAHIVSTKRGHQCQYSEQHAEHDGRQDVSERPGDIARQFDSPHADVMHAGHAGADDSAADRRAPEIRAAGGYAEAACRDHRCSGERQRGQPDVVRNRDARIISEHRDEMRRPDAASSRRAGGNDPGRARAPGGCAGTIEQTDRCQARQKADEPGDNDQAPIVLRCEASQNSKHRRARAGAEPMW
ncbi:MAG: hypothetical protein QOG38_917 [Hyphomicrobiales bacterium]|nr:hypothetical protein [Hyphomicrobiales bacterium]